jgi:glycosyltransferase involved in cell wall biosynthesis
MLEQLLLKDGFRVVFLPSNLPFPRWLRFLEALRGLRPFLRCALLSAKLWKEVPEADVVHVFTASWLYFFVVATPAFIVGRIRGKHTVLNYRGGEAGRFFRWFGWAAKPVFKLAGVVVTPSEFLAKLIRDRFGIPVQIVPNILDLSAFRYRKRMPFMPRMVVARHLEPAYDVETVVTAFRAVQAEYPEASLWICGTGSQESHLRGLVAGWGLKNVRFLGHVAHQDLPAIYDQCDILLNGSRIDNFPGALVEGTAAGMVVVSTDAGGIPYIYAHEKTALLVKPGDWLALAQAVIKVLKTPSLALNLTTQAVPMVREFEWAEVRRELYRVYGFRSASDRTEYNDERNPSRKLGSVVTR